MIEKTFVELTNFIYNDENDFKLNDVEYDKIVEKKKKLIWVLKSEHEELVRKLTKEILDLSFEVTELKGGVQK
jgi:hypothetical protein